MPHRLVIMTAALLLIAASEPPKDIPVPQAKPQQQDGSQAPSSTSEKISKEISTPPAENTVPKPEEKPDTAPKAGSTEPADTKAGDTKPDEEKKAEEPAPAPVKEENPQELQACLSELKEMGAEFKQIEPIKGEEAGCGIASPLEVTAVLPGMKLEPKGTMRCEAALALSRWAKNVVVPTTKIAMPDRQVTAFGNASTYICRNRNSAETGKISEHAKGNAVDIATLTFDKGEPLIMKPRHEDGTMEGAFQRTITTAACLFFRTVLSPGSDATHQDHLHLDVLERKGGYLYCR